jgi:ABC-type uncharacterized transport system YnjBCD substrate-binding protein
MKRHIVITGTGRAGTTFLMQLLTELGLDTGIGDPWSPAGFDADCKAGWEWNIYSPDAPYIIKSPSYCTYLEEMLASGQVRIEHVFVPIRDLFSAAESRRNIQQRSGKAAQAAVNGGHFGDAPAKEQEAILAQIFHHLFETLAAWDVPHTLLSFPRIVNDPQYLFRKLAPLLRGIEYRDFEQAFTRIARPDWVSHFAADSAQRQTPGATRKLPETS